MYLPTSYQLDISTYTLQKHLELNIHKNKLKCSPPLPTQPNPTQPKPNQTVLKPETLAGTVFQVKPGSHPWHCSSLFLTPSILILTPKCLLSLCSFLSLHYQLLGIMTLHYLVKATLVWLIKLISSVLYLIHSPQSQRSFQTVLIMTLST